MKKKKNNDIIITIFAIIFVLFIAFIIFLANHYSKDYGDFEDNEYSDAFDYVDDRLDIINGSVKDTLETDNLSITLDDVYVTDFIEGNNDTLKADNDKEFVVLTFTFYNKSLRNIYISSYDLRFVLDRNRYKDSYFYGDISGIKRLSNDIESNSSITGYVIYEVPKNWEVFDIHYLDDTNYYHKYDVKFNYVNQ